MKTIEEVEDAARFATTEIRGFEGLAKAAECQAERYRERARIVGKRFHREAVARAGLNPEKPIIIDIDGVHHWFHPDGRVTTPAEKEGG